MSVISGNRTRCAPAAAAFAAHCGPARRSRRDHRRGCRPGPGPPAAAPAADRSRHQSRRRRRPVTRRSGVTDVSPWSPPSAAARAMDLLGGPAYRSRVAEWLTIEVVDGEFPASRWRRSYEDALIEAALTHGADSWEWHVTRWGVVLELVFSSDEHLERFRALPRHPGGPRRGARPDARADRLPRPWRRRRGARSAPAPPPTDGRRRGAARNHRRSSSAGSSRAFATSTRPAGSGWSSC